MKNRCIYNNNIGVFLTKVSICIKKTHFFKKQNFVTKIQVMLKSYFLIKKKILPGMDKPFL